MKQMNTQDNISPTTFTCPSFTPSLWDGRRIFNEKSNSTDEIKIIGRVIASQKLF